MSGSAGLTIFSLAFQKSPIILCNGIANNFPYGMVPIISITEAANFTLGLLSGANIGPDNFFANFQPLPGSTLFNLEIGTYPFANQAVAANATIRQPLQLSMLMRCPARGTLGYAAKTATMIALQSVLSQHAASGGTYTVITPSYFYTNGILTALRDVSDAESHQVQNAYQWDFTFPLITLQQAQSAQGNLMQQLTNQTQINGTPAWSGSNAAIGNTNGLGAPNIIPATSGLPGAVTAPFPGY